MTTFAEQPFQIRMKTVLLLTEAYPFGGLTEEAFVRPEIDALAAAFDRVIVLPVSERGPMATGLPPNVEVRRDVIDSRIWQHKWLRPIRHPLALFRGADDFRYAFAAATVAQALEKIVGERGLTPDNTVMEAFWFDFPSSALCKLRRRGFRYVVRAHGYDIYTPRAPRQRERAIAASDGVYAVSEAGADYLRSRFNRLRLKINTAYLGTDLRVDGTRHSTCGAKSVRLLTVAQAIPRKRCDLCLRFAHALAVARPGWSIEWTLIGDGSELEAIRAQVASYSRENFRANILGAMSHSDVMAYLSRHTVDWLMLLSDEEGFGLVLIEAMSHGIPVIATDVGGIGESVDDTSGLLLAPDPEPEEFVRGILPYLDSRPRYEALCAGARRMAEEKFDSDALRRTWAANLRSLLP